ncbi:hypothetical protein BDM02DRAFT_3188754 [Thelephora ganbajun]|uniref:Uncharacterized protein n=1 Tax=Thelephora ganbajun TaxID=370292 RepID=A0ACB6ZAH7_THEGA|nr:hypothetical protein BDM02DRAFT_3188754 [Thelephora ganbajun]
MSFFLAVTLNSKIVRLAQQELDERLPGFSGKPRLPYISAIETSESFRVPAPLYSHGQLMVRNQVLWPVSDKDLSVDEAISHNGLVYPDAHALT